VHARCSSPSLLAAARSMTPLCKRPAAGRACKPQRAAELPQPCGAGTASLALQTHPERHRRKLAKAAIWAPLTSEAIHADEVFGHRLLTNHGDLVTCRQRRHLQSRHHSACSFNPATSYQPRSDVHADVDGNAFGPTAGRSLGFCCTGQGGASGVMINVGTVEQLLPGTVRLVITRQLPRRASCSAPTSHRAHMSLFPQLQPWPMLPAPGLHPCLLACFPRQSRANRVSHIRPLAVAAERAARHQTCGVATLVCGALRLLVALSVTQRASCTRYEHADGCHVILLFQGQRQVLLIL